jgi:hypothetical protein
MGIAWEGKRSPCCHQLGKTIRCSHDVSSSLESTAVRLATNRQGTSLDNAIETR